MNENVAILYDIFIWLWYGTSI